jgi:hypothetical protein
VQTGAYANATQLAQDEVAFQIIELTLDADDNVIERKSYPTPIKQAKKRSTRSRVS